MYVKFENSIKITSKSVFDKFYMMIRSTYINCKIELIENDLVLQG